MEFPIIGEKEKENPASPTFEPVQCFEDSGQFLTASQKKMRDARLQKAAELISGSKQPLPPGMLAHADRLYVENDKAIASMPSHHNLAALFEIICG